MRLKQGIVSAFLSLFLITTASAQEHLVFAVDLIRHGDRTPTHDIPKSPHQWQEGLGELTAEGMHQEYLLGEALRKKYIDQYHLLPPAYHAETIYVRSTDMNRTLMSANSFLLGLYPQGTGPALLPARYQPVPIHTVPIKEDKLLSVKSSKNIFSLAKLYFSAQKMWREKTHSMQDKMQHWSELTGLNVNDYRQFIALADNLYIRKIHHIPLPSGMSASDADEIIALGNWALTTAYKFNAISYPTGHLFLTAVASYFENASEQKNALKYVLFSAHDSTMMSVMDTLGVPVDAAPPYASDLNFSLYEENKKYVVKITFNRRSIKIPGCEKEVCSLEQFVRFIR